MLLPIQGCKNLRLPDTVNVLLAPTAAVVHIDSIPAVKAALQNPAIDPASPHAMATNH